MNKAMSLTLTGPQAALHQKLMAEFAKGPRVEAILLSADFGGGDASLGMRATTNVAPLFVASAEMLLRNALLLLQQQDQWPNHAASLAAVRTALFHLEALGFTTASEPAGALQ